MLGHRVGGGRDKKEEQAGPRLEEMSWWWSWSHAALQTELKGVWKTQAPTSKGYTAVEAQSQTSINTASAHAGDWSPRVWAVVEKAQETFTDSFKHSFVHSANTH